MSYRNHSAFPISSQRSRSWWASTTTYLYPNLRKRVEQKMVPRDHDQRVATWRALPRKIVACHASASASNINTDLSNYWRYISVGFSREYEKQGISSTRAYTDTLSHQGDFWFNFSIFSIFQFFFFYRNRPFTCSCFFYLPRRGPRLGVSRSMERGLGTRLLIICGIHEEDDE